ncbi:MAG TPA: histidine phosphatase family protein [Gemmatales bacterium]|nr:histidine phosphatase family protein [Gemmatales bacterium]
MSISSSPLVSSFVILCLVPSASYSQQTIFLVRHADRDLTVPDALKSEGYTRASDLAATLKDAGITVVIRSDTIRTKDTALPIVRSRGIPEKIIKADDDHVKKSYEAIRAAGANARVLYVGHSNTIPPLLSKLGCQPEVTIGEREYGDMFIVVPKEPNPMLIKLHFGK